MHRTDIKTRTFMFADDGVIPNNPALPLVLYPKVFDLSGTDDPASTIEKTFEKNGWRNGIYGPLLRLWR